jgi:hypothetical protein
MSEPPSIPYENRVVAFVDILGFRALVSKLQSDPLLHRRLHRALAAIKSVGLIAGDAQTAQGGLEASVFSDSIVISGGETQLLHVIWTCVGLQARLLAIGVLTRGGISRGLTHHKEDVLYGEGMVRAFDLESRAAIYPRVVIDPALMSDILENIRVMLLNLDVDGLWHTDPFSFGVLPDGSEDLLEDGHDPHLVFLESFANRIDQEIEAAKDAGILAKWGWMKSKLREAIEFHTKHGHRRLLWQTLKLTGYFNKEPNKAPATVFNKQG